MHLTRGVPCFVVLQLLHWCCGQTKLLPETLHAGTAAAHLGEGGKGPHEKHSRGSVMGSARGQTASPTTTWYPRPPPLVIPRAGTLPPLLRLTSPTRQAALT